MSTEYRLIVSTNTRLWDAQITKDLTSLQQPLPFVPTVAIVERFNFFKKYLGSLNYHVHLYDCSFAQSSISDKEEKRRE